MRLFATPPCETMKVKKATATRLELGRDPSGLGSGMQVAFGGVFAATALRIAAIAPGPMKLLPLGFVAIGSLVSASGLVDRYAHHTLIAERSRGVTIRWKPGGFKERERVVPRSAIVGFEVLRVVHSSGTDSSYSYHETFELALVPRDGQPLGLESFRSRTQAELRQRQIEQVLGPAKASRRVRAGRRAGVKAR